MAWATRAVPPPMWVGRHCSIACDLCIEPIPALSGFAVMHNEHLVTVETLDDAEAYVRALHFFGNSDKPPSISRGRLMKAIPSDGPLAYDVQHAVQSGVYTMNEARNMLVRDTSKYQMPCYLHHNQILQEVGRHLIYNMVDEEGSVTGRLKVLAATDAGSFWMITLGAPSWGEDTQLTR